MQINVDLIYPIGSIYMTTSTVSPAVLFGGTWERIKGRCIVGVDESDTDFETVSKTGGSKYLQNHTHTLNGGSSNYYGGSGDTGRWLPQYDENQYKWRVDGVSDVQTGNSGNLQPYYTAYIWRRTA